MNFSILARLPLERYYTAELSCMDGSPYISGKSPYYMDRTDYLCGRKYNYGPAMYIFLVQGVASPYIAVLWVPELTLWVSELTPMYFG